MSSCLNFRRSTHNDGNQRDVLAALQQRIRTMRVAMVNLTFRSLSGGYIKYLNEIVPRLRNEREIDDLLVFVPPGHERLEGLGNDARTWTTHEPWLGYRNVVAQVRAWQPDVVFIPTARFVNCGAPTLCMVHNMLPMYPPPLRGAFRTWIKLRLDAALAHRAVHRADRVMAVSQFVRDHLVQRWNVPPSRVSVVTHGVDAPTFSDAPTHAALQDEFLFSAGSLHSYRGYEDAIRALSLVQSKPLRLVIAGDGNVAYRTHLDRLVAELGLARRVVWLGHVDSGTMAQAYQRCRAFLMTSRVEACPNIALEAMAHGARCISTSCAPMPEFFGDCARYYDAADATALAQHIDSVLGESDAKRLVMRNRAIERASGFSWQSTLQGLMQELQTTAQLRIG